MAHAVEVSLSDAKAGDSLVLRGVVCASAGSGWMFLVRKGGSVSVNAGLQEEQTLLSMIVC